MLLSGLSKQRCVTSWMKTWSTLSTRWEHFTFSSCGVGANDKNCCAADLSARASGLCFKAYMAPCVSTPPQSPGRPPHRQLYIKQLFIAQPAAMLSLSVGGETKKVTAHDYFDREIVRQEVLGAICISFWDAQRNLFLSMAGQWSQLWYVQSFASAENGHTRKRIVHSRGRFLSRDLRMRLREPISELPSGGMRALNGS